MGIKEKIKELELEVARFELKVARLEQLVKDLKTALIYVAKSD